MLHLQRYRYCAFLQLQLHCNFCNATVVVRFCMRNFIASVAGYCCSCDRTVALRFCSCNFIATVAAHCNATVAVRFRSCILTATAASHCYSCNATVACFSACATSMQWLEHSASVAMQPLQCVSPAASLQLLWLIATAAMQPLHAFLQLHIHCNSCSILLQYQYNGGSAFLKLHLHCNCCSSLLQ